MSRPLMIGTCERGTPTASVVPDRRNTRRSQPSENYRGSAQKAVQRKPAQRSPRARLPNGPTSPGSPTEECLITRPTGDAYAAPYFLSPYLEGSYTIFEEIRKRL